MDFPNLPDPPADDLVEEGSALAPQMPHGHPPTASEPGQASMCPFAAIQAAINSRAMNGNGSPSQALEQSVTPLGVMADLGGLPAAIPEGFAVSEELPASRMPKVVGSGRGHLGLTAVLEPSASFTGSTGGSKTGSKRQGSQASKSK
eukprot:2527494-Rhodomonas_salina.1